MAIITKVSSIINAEQETVDLSTNTLSVGDLQVAGQSLTQTAVAATFTGVIPGTSTSVSLLAVWPGTAGNNITLTFTGSNSITTAITTWNLAHLSNQVTLSSGNGAQIPTAGTTILSGGLNPGSAAISSLSTYENFTPTSPTVAGALQGIDEALASISSGSEKVDTFTLNGTNITNKNIALTATPLIPASVVLLVANAGSMFYGVDFTVSGDLLSWSGLALDGIFSSGDNLTVIYSI